MTLFLAIALGLAFGFVLQRIGAADPHKIIGMLTLTDLHLMKAILTGIGISSALLFLGLAMDLINPAHLSIKSMYVGVIVGGLLLGFGWALAGYCPGTGLVALGAGRIDALFFVLGGLVGAGIFTSAYGILEGDWLMTALFADTPSLAGSDHHLWLALLIGAMLIGLAAVIPARLRG